MFLNDPKAVIVSSNEAGWNAVENANGITVVDLLPKFQDLGDDAEVS